MRIVRSENRRQADFTFIPTEHHLSIALRFPVKTLFQLDFAVVFGAAEVIAGNPFHRLFRVEAVVIEKPENELACPAVKAAVNSVNLIFYHLQSLLSGVVSFA